MFSTQLYYTVFVLVIAIKFGNIQIIITVVLDDNYFWIVCIVCEKQTMQTIQKFIVDGEKDLERNYVSNWIQKTIMNEVSKNSTHFRNYNFLSTNNFGKTC